MLFIFINDVTYTKGGLFMVNDLQKLYPNDIRERNEILQEIMDTPDLRDTYTSWSTEHQTHFLDFCAGTRGVKMLRDGFFNCKYVLSLFIV